MCYIVFLQISGEVFADIKEFAGFSDVIQSTASSLSDMQIFGVLNIADQPLTIIKSAFGSGSWLVLAAAVLVHCWHG